MSNTTTTFLSGLTAGILIGILIAPMEGKRMRQILFSKDDGSEGFEQETYSINELLSENSTSFSELKQKIENDISE